MSVRTGQEVYSGRYIRVLRDPSGWEYLERCRGLGVVAVVALTNDDKLLLTEQYRRPLGKTVIDLPAGLIGDEETRKGESAEEAALKELAEETGYRGKDVKYLCERPTSPGITNETVKFFQAENLERIGSGGGVDGERISAHAVPYAILGKWLAERAREGCLIDPKIDVARRYLDETVLGRSFYSPIVNRRVELSLDRVRGVLLGIALGDALGLPLESMTAAKIREKYGFVTDFVGRDGQKPGTVSDDTRLSLVMMETIRRAGRFDIKACARLHIQAADESTLGWGGSTKRGVERMRQGVDPGLSGVEADPWSGLGNGVAMKIAPLAIYAIAAGLTKEEFEEAVVSAAIMTHNTYTGIASALVQAHALLECLTAAPGEFIPERFVEALAQTAERAKRYVVKKPNEEDLAARLRSLSDFRNYDQARLEKEFGGGSCLAWNSLPFSYGWFLKEPYSLKSLFETVNAGGDTDTNASIVGALLGALNGASLFPERLADGLLGKDRLEDEALLFCHSLGVR